MLRDTNSFAERYLERPTAELKLLAESGELTEEAQAAIEAELVRREVRIKKPTKVSIRQPTRPKALESKMSKANLTSMLPKPGIGYFLAIMIAGLGLIPEAFAITLFFSMAASLYWLACVSLIHYSVKKWTLNQYSIGPFLSVLFHIIPIFNLLWIFLWPGFLGSELRARGFRPTTSAYLGFLILLGGILTVGSDFLPVLVFVLFHFDPDAQYLGFTSLLTTLGFFLLFSVISTINSDLREVQEAPAPRMKRRRRPRKISARRHRLPPRPRILLNTEGVRRAPRKFRMVFLEPNTRVLEKLRQWP